MATPSSQVASVLSQASEWAAANVPYVWGGVSQLGADCSGEVQTIFANAGISLPRTSEQQATVGQDLGTNLANASPGDLIFYGYEGPDSHVAIYLGNGEQEAETQPGQGAVIQPVDTSNVEDIRNVIPGNSSGNPNLTGFDLPFIGNVGLGGSSSSSFAGIPTKIIIAIVAIGLLFVGVNALTDSNSSPGQIVVKAAGTAKKTAERGAVLAK